MAKLLAVLALVAAATPFLCVAGQVRFAGTQELRRVKMRVPS